MSIELGGRCAMRLGIEPKDIPTGKLRNGLGTTFCFPATAAIRSKQKKAVLLSRNDVLEIARRQILNGNWHGASPILINRYVTATQNGFRGEDFPAAQTPPARSRVSKFFGPLLTLTFNSEFSRLFAVVAESAIFTTWLNDWQVPKSESKTAVTHLWLKLLSRWLILSWH